MAGLGESFCSWVAFRELLPSPRFYLKRGEISSEDLANFPGPLKRKLVALQWSVICLLLVMISFGAAVKSGFL